ncbi:pentatricopeptide repeat-containing protein At5g50280, chloroplastic-like isoform X1 [Vigna unguiculata]|uniref:pentatricopeptide repeat-containing protein At5g50280, chloroplastic-like isoform X1 n=1 Tax=Vigna unguiculata TaxID=3917 RepID=UPI00101700AB|nr:pentatricopeptide repeat-containing protein At5g50280, chloroplastic-like isoform X1 [Vigna unguiculata]XP_027941962.1 pentatricopeptide repeat-containing protein At5g50280, chloroplastic-like isoform X1 [Vigna unguiculata]XP_027941963.1 pentatricopeptide repeat-containing protein At5g50280, chloroplastic-like isoform X1 [Vigna unguiculata]XP_027941964.1 pentatricopeptide repeat-containing protein At5g50280, chloroplastic-like isoform X1 [Vigna unguiculata]XP_027941965.1 pentatricopeptide re
MVVIGGFTGAFTSFLFSFNTQIETTATPSMVSTSTSSWAWPCVLRRVPQQGRVWPNKPRPTRCRTRVVHASVSSTRGRHGGAIFMVCQSFLEENPFTLWHIDEEPEMSLEIEEMGSCQSRELREVEGVVGEIVQLARNLPQNLTLEEALGEYEGRVNEKDCWEVLEILGEERLLLCCVSFFRWMSLQESSLVTPRASIVLFPLLGKGGMGDEVMGLFGSLPSSMEFRDVHVYNATISGLLYGGRYEDAWKVYESMETENIHPDHVTCSIMVTVMRKLGHSAKDAWQFFEKMNRKGVRWSEEVLSALIKSFCDEGLMRVALVIQSEMEKKGVSSNAIVYNILMDSYCKYNHVEAAEGLFVEMRAKGIKPTVATFNILMHAYSRRMQPKIVEKLMAEMQDVGLKPNAESYTCLISAYGKQKTPSDLAAADAFLRMKEVGIKSTSHSYTALIHAYSVNGLHEKAYIAFENMKMEGIKPCVETYNTLLDVLRRAGEAQTLMEIWKLMKNDKIELTRTTFNVLVDGFSKQGLYMEARGIISEFGKLGMQPTVMTYNMLMNAYAKGGQHSKLPQIFKEMAVLNLQPDSVTYSTMIFGFVRVHDFKRAFLYHKQMVKNKQTMDVSFYQTLLDILEARAARKNKDWRALHAQIKGKTGVKVIRQKDEFWKYYKRRRGRKNNSDGFILLFQTERFARVPSSFFFLLLLLRAFQSRGLNPFSSATLVQAYF